MGILLLCLPSACGHPLGSLASFVTIARQRRFPLEGFFPISEWCCSFPTSSLCLSWLLVAGDCAFHLLVTVLTSTHLLLASAAASPSALGVLPYFPYGCAALLSLWLCAHLRLGQRFFFCFLPALRPPLGSWYTGSCGFSSPLRFPAFAMGSPLRGRGLFVLDRNEGLVSPFGSGTLDSSWLALQTLSAGVCAPCSSGCVASWSSLCPSPSVILSSLQGSSLSRVGVQCYLPDPC